MNKQVVIAYTAVINYVFSSRYERLCAVYWKKPRLSGGPSPAIGIRPFPTVVRRAGTVDFLRCSRVCFARDGRKDDDGLPAGGRENLISRAVRTI